MLNWLRRLRSPAPLRGAPAVRRQKTYSAESGYVYQYFYEGHREAKHQGHPATEFVFDVTSDRKTSFPVSVFVSQQVLTGWQQRNGRALTSTECYAIAKMGLFHAFDTRDHPESMHLAINLSGDDVDRFLETLGID
jgi:hypothetical protein